MKVLNEKPPIWNDARAKFDFDESKTIFTYGDTIYNPGGISVTEDLQVHERVHERQQAAFGGGPKAWWKRYIKDPKFRFEQELEAYRAQYAFYRQNIKDRNRLNGYLTAIARELKGPMYNNVMKELGYEDDIYDVMALIRYSD